MHSWTLNLKFLIEKTMWRPLKVSPTKKELVSLMRNRICWQSPVTGPLGLAREFASQVTLVLSCPQWLIIVEKVVWPFLSHWHPLWGVDIALELHRPTSAQPGSVDLSQMSHGIRLWKLPHLMMLASTWSFINIIFPFSDKLLELLILSHLLPCWEPDFGCTSVNHSLDWWMKWNHPSAEP